MVRLPLASTARHVAKRVIEKLLRVAPRSPRHMRGRAVILAYHNVVPDGLEGRGDASLHLPLTAFLQQVELLQKHCRILPLAEILTGRRSDEGPVVALTFDDAYRGAVEYAIPALAQRGIPSTLFVAPGLLGERSFWWDDLALDGGGLPDGIRERVLEREAGRPEFRPNRVAPVSVSPLPTCYGCAGVDEVKALASRGPVVLGAHTWSHPNLNRIGAAELSSELSRPIEWLRAAAVPLIPVLAYPYGLSSPPVEAAAAEAGYEAAVRIEGGWFEGVGNRWRIPRYNVPAGLSRDGLMLRLSGMLSLSSGEPGG